MRIFVLDDDPQVVPLTRYIQGEGHLVDHAKKPKQVLNDAFLWLAHQPGASKYSRFFFDAAVPTESVYNILHKRMDVYQDPDGFNGLRFMLHNLKFYKERTNHVAIFTAHHTQVSEKEEIDVFGVKFIQEEIPKDEKEKLEKNGKAPKIRFYFEELESKKKQEGEPI